MREFILHVCDYSVWSSFSCIFIIIHFLGVRVLKLSLDVLWKFIIDKVFTPALIVHFFRKVTCVLWFPLDFLKIGSIFWACRNLYQSSAILIFRGKGYYQILCRSWNPQLLQSSIMHICAIFPNIFRGTSQHFLLEIFGLFFD